MLSYILCDITTKLTHDSRFTFLIFPFKKTADDRRKCHRLNNCLENIQFLHIMTAKICF